MDWFRRYQPPQADNWRGRKDGPGAERYHETVKLVDLQKGFPTPSQTAAYGILGFASDEGIKRNIGRLGAAQGPQAMRQALAKMPAPNPSAIEIYDLGDITCQDGQLEEAQASLGIVVAMLLAQSIKPLIIGGGHEVTWGTFQGISIFNPSLDIAMINFDAHYDLRPLENSKGTSGTSFTQIAEALKAKEKPFNYTCIGLQTLGNTRALHQKANELNVQILNADEIHENPHKILGLVNELLQQHSAFYVTLCLDVFAAPYAPGVSAPQPLGILPAHVLPAIHALADSDKVVAFEIAELSPPHDPDGRTALLAASLLSAYLS